jgi:phage tail protein X
MRKYYTVNGDTWDQIALDCYGEERTLGTLIAANPQHSDVVVFEAGVDLVIPDKSSVALPETLPPWRRSV